MHKLALGFLKKHRVCSLTVLLPDSSPHASALHYVANPKTAEVYIMTENTSKKVQSLLAGGQGKASFVTGFSDEEWATLQMDGVVRVESNKSVLKKIHKIYFEGNPGPEKYKDDPATLFLVFTPKWWRYTEYKPKFKVLTSEK